MPNTQRPNGSPPKRPPGKKRSRGRRWLLFAFLLFVERHDRWRRAGWRIRVQRYQDLPTFHEFDPDLTSVIYDRYGNKVYELAMDEHRTLVDLEDIPVDVRNAVIAVEDRRFNEHFGIDPIRLAGAVWSDIKYVLGVPGSQLEGGSTITMQLARNAFLTLDQTIKRKVQEMLIAVQLERRYTKPEILEQYLNTVAWGGTGLRHRGRRADVLLQARERAHPLRGGAAGRHPEGPLGVQPVHQLGGRPGAAGDRARPDGGAGVPGRRRGRAAQEGAARAESRRGHAGDGHLHRRLVRRLRHPDPHRSRGSGQVQPDHFSPDDLYQKGLRIYTALDPEKQRIVQEKLWEIMPAATVEYSGSEDTEVPEAAVVVMDHTTGEVLALVGGMEHEHMLGFNRATQARRDPGSTIKPIVAYLPAIDLLGWGPATIIDDSPPRLNEDGTNVWPENYEYNYQGLKTMRWVVEQSRNAAAVRTLEAVTPPRAWSTARSWACRWSPCGGPGLQRREPRPHPRRPDPGRHPPGDDRRLRRAGQPGTEDTTRWSSPASRTSTAR